MRLLTIVRHEWRLLVAERTIPILSAVLALAIAGGVVNGVRWHRLHTQTIDEATREERERHAAADRTLAEAAQKGATLSPFADPGNPDTAGRRQAARYAVLPALPLAPLAVGQGDLLPAFYRVSSEAREVILAAGDTENPLRLLTGRFDVAFVIIYLVPLLTLALAHNLLSSEQEQGTLALALSQPIRLRDLIAGKVVVRFAIILAVVVASAAFACVAAGLPILDADGGLRFLLWTAVVGAYALFWLAVSVAVASFGLSSAANAMTLSGLWLTLTVLVPSAINLAVMTLYPVPSRVELVQAMREAAEDATAEGAHLLGQYYQDHPEFAADTSERAVTDFNVVKLAVDERTEALVRPVSARFDEQLARQQALVERVRYLSPAILVQEALNDLSGTGATRHRRFVAQVLAFHDQWRQFFARLVVAKSRLQGYDAVPRFTLADEGLGEVSARVLTSFAALAALAAALLTVAGLRFRRWQVVGR